MLYKSLVSVALYLAINVYPLHAMAEQAIFIPPHPTAPTVVIEAVQNLIACDQLENASPRTVQAINSIRLSGQKASSAEVEGLLKDAISEDDPVAMYIQALIYGKGFFDEVKPDLSQTLLKKAHQLGGSKFASVAYAADLEDAAEDREIIEALIDEDFFLAKIYRGNIATWASMDREISRYAKETAKADFTSALGSCLTEDEAAIGLGTLLIGSAETSLDIEQGKKLLEQEAAKGSVRALTLLGYWYDLGKGNLLPSDGQKARNYYEQAIAKDEPYTSVALLGLADGYMNGFGDDFVNVDISKAAEFYRRLAFHGWSVAQAEYAQFLATGIISHDDPNMAERMFETSLAQNFDIFVASNFAEYAQRRGTIDSISRAIALYSEIQAKADSEARTDEAKVLMLVARAEVTQRNLQTQLEVLKKENEAQLVAKQASQADISFGQYHALIIGNSKYKFLTNLKTANRDAERISDLLQDGYGFEVQYLKDATRSQIIGAIANYRKVLKVEDNFLLYYAGHGHHDEELGIGYWQPVNAQLENPANWISTEDITLQLRAFKSMNALVIADSCYSASIFRGDDELKPGNTNDSETLRRLLQTKTRVAMTSGGMEPIADSIDGGNFSVFANSLAKVLEANKEPVPARQLFPLVQDRVISIMSKAGYSQTPDYRAILRAGHEGGDFIFSPVLNNL